MSNRTTPRRVHARAMRKIERRQQVVCRHPHSSWVHSKSTSLLVCTVCGEVLKEEQR